MKLAEKLAAIMGEIDHVEKRGRNTFHNYNYVKASDLANVVRKKLAEKKVILIPDVVSAHNYTIPAKDGVQQAVDLHVKYTFYDGESDEVISFHGHGTGTDKGDKATYKANTGALKYALRNAFLVPDESDPEADEPTDRNTQAPTAVTAVQPTPKQAAAPRLEQPKPPAPPTSGDVARLTVTAISKKPTAKGDDSWGFKTERGWLNCFDPVVGDAVEKGETYDFLLKSNGKYTNIIGFAQPEEQAPIAPMAFSDGTMVSDEDCPF